MTCTLYSSSINSIHENALITARYIGLLFPINGITSQHLILVSSTSKSYEKDGPGGHHPHILYTLLWILCFDNPVARDAKHNT